jgi:hypothetical protein
MAALISLTEQELAELKTYTRETDDTAAVRSAVAAYLRLARRLQLKELSGKIEMDDNWRMLKAAEVRDDNGGSGTGAH